MLRQVVSGNLPGAPIRSEQLAATGSLPAQADGKISRLPEQIRVMLKTMEVAHQCFEEGLESPTCLEILAKYPRRTKAQVK